MQEARVLAQKNSLSLTSGTDYNSVARRAVTSALRKIPRAGFLISALVDILWPNGDGVWEQIEAKVEALINQKIADHVFEDVKDALEGLHAVLEEYAYATNSEHLYPSASISTIFTSVENHFRHDEPRFRSPGYDLLLLPLFAQFATMHLSLLRDGAFPVDNWQRTEIEITRTKDLLNAAIKSYTKHVDDTFAKSLADIRARNPNYAKDPVQFNVVNAWIREITLTVLDFRYQWDFFNQISTSSKPIQTTPVREIYSDAVGKANGSNNVFNPPSAAPTQAIHKITVWGWDRIDAVIVEYPANGGPGGISTTGRMGNASGGSMTDGGGQFDLTQKPIKAVKTLTGDILNTMWFQFSDDSWSNQLGGKYVAPTPTRENIFSYPGEILSSVKIMGMSNFYKSADCAIFGFKFVPGQDVDANTILQLFKASPHEADPGALALSLAAPAHVVAQVRDLAAHQDLVKERRTHWEFRGKRVMSRKSKNS